ncbi:MAG: cytochrome c biogenesis protein ResB [Planctomycetes bacterium]|nr:cytochrome c biogenesis protein ResB [Planctomycetota bacterium]
MNFTRKSDHLNAPGTLHVPRLGRSLGLAAALWSALTVIGHLGAGDLFRHMSGQALAVGAFGGAGVFFWMIRKGLFRWLTSPSFAVSAFAFLLLAAAVGTVVPQGMPAEQFSGRYGAWSGALRWGGVHDISHSVPFRGFLVLLAISLALVAIKRKAWRLPEWGFLLSHAGVIVILTGGLIGSVFGMKGFIDIHEGQTVETVARQGEARPTSGVPLGFGLRLDDFEIERYPQQYRLYVYALAGDDARVVGSHDVRVDSEWRPAGGAKEQVRVVAVYPDFTLRTELRETPEGGPALVLRLEEWDGRTFPVTLLAGVEGRETLALRRPPARIRFLWEEDPAALGAKPEEHLVTFEADGASPQETHVEPGGSYALGEARYQLAVLSYFPDFAYDSERREGYTRSSTPGNPALRVSLRDSRSGDVEERWLFAKMPDYGGTHGRGSSGVKLSYRHVPAREPMEREIVVAGRARQVVEYQRAVETSRTALPPDGEPLAEGLDVTVERLVERAEELHFPATRSDVWRRPAVGLEIRSARGTQRMLLKAGVSEAIRLSDGKTVLVLDRKPDDVKAFRSRVTVLDKGAAARRATLSVNHPLSYGGYRFYQSNYRAEDPTYSGLLVVKDPGLGVVYAGFGMICAGVMFIFYVRPAILRARILARRKVLEG